MSQPIVRARVTDTMTVPQVGFPELVRIFAIQAKPQLMFMLGAGASARAGIPTATDMIWMFKREIYCSERGASKEALRDLSAERIRQMLQKHFDNKPNFPPLGAETEYAFYFERCYSDPQARRSFIRQKIQQGRPTIGHKCLATLLAEGLCEWVWTTNFDDLIERAERADGIRRIALASPEMGLRSGLVFDEAIQPVLIKLHGDYRYDSLQNTDDELKSLDNRLRLKLLEASQRQGLIVVGYSGRDESVMSALEDAASQGGFKAGLYWCIREGGTVSARVGCLVTDVRERSGRGGLVEIPGFDDLMVRLYRQCDLHDTLIDDEAETLYEQRQRFVFTVSVKPHAVLKSNAIQVVQYPTSPFRFRSSVQDWKELRQRVRDIPVVAGLHSGYVLAFGQRERIVEAFSDTIVEPLEVADISPARLARNDSVELGLLYSLISKSLEASWGLARIGKSTFFIPDPARSKKDRIFRFQHNKSDYRMPVATPRDGAIACEGFKYQLDFRSGHLWFIVEPTVVITRDGEQLASDDLRKTLTNKIVSSRYNATNHKLLLFWLYYLKTTANPILFTLTPQDDPAIRVVLDNHYAFTSLRDE